MLKQRIFFLFIVVLALGAILPAAAQSTPTPAPFPPDTEPPVFREVIRGVFTNPDWLNIDYNRVEVQIENQIAQTTVDMQFTNNGNGLAEGTFVFPLPAEASVDQLTMFIDGVGYDGKILDATEARNIYDEIVRQYRDPALLEYIGTQALQANVFPIPPGESRRILIAYSQVLTVDNGLIGYTYALGGTRPVSDTSIRVQVSGSDPISTIYSPSHNIAVSREGDTGFRAGWETSNSVNTEDFSLYYGLANDTIDVSLLTYRESAGEDGFFMLLVQPPLEVDAAQVTPKDIILVLDQSGSMDGEKWQQAREAAAYVLRNLNPEDRFNVVVFSTGTRIFSSSMESVDAAEEAVNWINTLWAEGGTNINEALLTALDMVGERPTTIMFMTDGEATEGVMLTEEILANLDAASTPNARIFTFGVGDDVNTLLLDAIVRDFRGAGTYVRPTQRIDESVQSLYTKISAPVLSDIELAFDGLRMVELMYPAQIADLFAGEQITLVGRYRGSADAASITLSGTVNGQPQTFSYDDLSFRERAGGEAFIARLWATRRIGDLLNTIRLNGESEELVDSIISLSVRYGIITPYTSFLIEEDDILTQEGRRRAAADASAEFEAMADEETGEAAVQMSVDIDQLSRAPQSAPAMAAAPTASAFGTPSPADVSDDAVAGSPGSDVSAPRGPIQTVGSKTFIEIDGVWTDTAFEPDTMQTEPVAFLSDAYFDLLDAIPELAAYFAIGERVIVVYEGVAYEVTE